MTFDPHCLVIGCFDAAAAASAPPPPPPPRF